MMDEAKSVGGSYRSACGTVSLLTPGTVLSGKKLQLAGAQPGKASQGTDWLKAMFTLNDNFLTDGNGFYLLCVV